MSVLHAPPRHFLACRWADESELPTRESPQVTVQTHSLALASPTTTPLLALASVSYTEHRTTEARQERTLLALRLQNENTTAPPRV